MWLTKFLDIISKVLPEDPLSGKGDALLRLNPNKIYVENVRSLLGVSHRQAVAVCESAVRQGFFTRRVEVVCPDGTVAASADSEINLPPVVRCWQQDDENLEEVELPTSELRKAVFYQLNAEKAAGLYKRTA